MDDKYRDLISEAKNGNVAAFEKLIKTYHDKIFAFALSITGGNYPVALDLYQEATLKAYQRRVLARCSVFGKRVPCLSRPTQSE